MPCISFMKLFELIRLLIFLLLVLICSIWFKKRKGQKAWSIVKSMQHMNGNGNGYGLLTKYVQNMYQLTSISSRLSTLDLHTDITPSIIVVLAYLKIHHYTICWGIMLSTDSLWLPIEKSRSTSTKYRLQPWTYHSLSLLSTCKGCMLC